MRAGCFLVCLKFGMFNGGCRPHSLPVRIPIPVAIFFCLLAIAIPGWLGMRHADFLTPPDEAALNAIRAQAESALPRLATQSDAISPEGSGTHSIANTPSIQLGNLSIPPQLNEYAIHARHGAPYLIELANRLENEGHQGRALLAWERVIDHAESAESEIQVATEAIGRLRSKVPAWHANPEQRLAITIQAGTGKKSAEALIPVLAQAASDLELASSGTLKISSKVNTGPDADHNDGPVPVAIWISGPDSGARSTEVRSFTVATPETLEHDIHRTLYLLVQNHLRNAPEVKCPPTPPDAGDSREAINTHITRLQWKKFAELLKAP